MSDQIQKLTDRPKRGWLDGRANRREYWLFVAPLVIAGSVLVALGQGWAPFVTGLGIFLWMIRRLHDMGRSGFLAPVINIAVAVVNFGLKSALSPDLALMASGLVSFAVLIGLGAWPGTPGDNDYGPPPGRRKASVAEVFS